MFYNPEKKSNERGAEPDFFDPAGEQRRLKVKSKLALHVKRSGSLKDK
jgi:hypothetical protein